MAPGSEIVYNLNYKRSTRLSTALGSANNVVTTFEALHYQRLDGRRSDVREGGGAETGIYCTIINPPGDCT